MSTRRSTSSAAVPSAAGHSAEQDAQATSIVNIAAHLPAMAQRQPGRLAVVFPEGRDAAGRVAHTHYTFAQLDRASNEIASGLEQVGIGRGVRTVLMVRPSLDFFALTFALFKVGAVPVLIDPGIGVRNLKACIGEAQPEAFIGIPKAHAARLLLGWGRESIRMLVTVGRRWGWGGVTLESVRRRGLTEYQPAATAADDVAAILFTSGSTGVPKGALYSHGNFAAQVAFLKQTYGIEPGEIDLPTFPLFALFAPALGMTAIIPDMDPTRPAHVDPRKIIGAIEDFGVTTMFGSPALLDRVSRYGVEHGVQLPSLRRVLSAGAPVPAAVLERCSQMLTGEAEIYTPYGATESLPVSSIGSREVLEETAAGAAAGRGVCVGEPVDGVDVRIIATTDDPIAEWSEAQPVAVGEIGEICVRGPNVTARYYGRDDHTALGKIRCASGGFYHRMGDLGYLDERGRLWFCGRKSQRVRAADGQVYHTVACEGVFDAHPAVRRTALVAVERAGRVEPVLCVERDKEVRGPAPAQLQQELRALGAQHEHTRAIREILFHDSFPVDIRHNAKIFREKLAVWAAQAGPSVAG